MPSSSFPPVTGRLTGLAPPADLSSCSWPGGGGILVEYFGGGEGGSDEDGCVGGAGCGKFDFLWWWLWW